MLAPVGTSLRGEQDRLLEGLFSDTPPVICQAQLPLLQKLAALGGADAILPLHLIPPDRWDHCYALQPPQPYYLVLAYHPSRHLPRSALDLSGLIREVFDAWPEKDSWQG